MSEAHVTHLPGELMAPSRDDALVVRAAGWMLLAGILRLAAASILTATAVAPDLGGGTAARIAIGLAAAAIAAIAVRTFVEGAYVEEDGVLVRNVFRSWHVRWNEIEGVAPYRGGLLSSLALRDGRRIPLYGWGRPSAARRQRMAALLLGARPEPAR